MPPYPPSVAHLALQAARASLTPPFSVRALLIDLSGTLHVGDDATPGAIDAIRNLRAAGTPLRWLSNTSKESRRDLLQRMRRIGLDVREEELFTSLSTASDLVKVRKLNPLYLLSDSSLQDFPHSFPPFDSVVVGLAPQHFNYATLNEAFRLLSSPAPDGGKVPFIATHKALYYRSGDGGLSLGPGPFITALEEASGIKAEIGTSPLPHAPSHSLILPPSHSVGKPSLAFFNLAIDSLPPSFRSDLSSIAIIGDDKIQDIGKVPLELGLRRILVRTGKYRDGDEREVEVGNAGVEKEANCYILTDPRELTKKQAHDRLALSITKSPFLSRLFSLASNDTTPAATLPADSALPLPPHSIHPPPKMNQLIVFDFDWTLIDQDCDYYIQEVLSPKTRYHMSFIENNGKMWLDAVSECLVLLHQEGKTRADMQNALADIPFHPATKRAIRSLKSRTNTSFLLLSNANSFFIFTILAVRLSPSLPLPQTSSPPSPTEQNHSLSTHFDEIVTNPAEFDPKSGLLRLRPRLDPALGHVPHTCTFCETNMCKGDELDAYVERNGGWASMKRVVYVGDGSNDFCPVLRLREQDLALPRLPRSLSTLIRTKGKEMGMKCKVEEWQEAWELERILDKFD